LSVFLISSDLICINQKLGFWHSSIQSWNMQPGHLYLFATFHLILPQYVYTRIFMTLRQTLLGEKSLCGWLVFERRFSVSFGPTNTHLGFGFTLELSLAKSIFTKQNQVTRKLYSGQRLYWILVLPYEQFNGLWMFHFVHKRATVH
jgi:hypothetical protein